MIFSSFLFSSYSIFDLFRVNVTSNNHYLHSIEPKQFLDSPEFESSKTGKEDKFNVTITASMPCTYVLWQRQALDYLLIKETFLATTLNLILARDVTDKLYAMNEKVIKHYERKEKKIKLYKKLIIKCFLVDCH